MIPPTTILGYPVLYIRPDFTSPPSMKPRRLTDTTAGNAGNLVTFPAYKVRHVLNRDYVFSTRAEAYEFEEFYNDRRGRWGDFFVPGWHAELQPMTALTNSMTQVQIAPVRYNTIYQPADNRELGRWIYVLNRDGGMHVSKVTAATEGTSADTLTLETAIDRLHIAGTFHIGFIYFVRFVNDRLRLEFDGPDFITTTAPMIESFEKTAGTI